MDDIIQIKHGRNGFSVIIEANGRSVHGYLVCNCKISGDVWLCNMMPSPLVPEWKTGKALMPFMNPKPFVLEQQLQFNMRKELFSAKWIEDDNDIIRCILLYNNTKIADMSPWVYPGHCINASTAGPLARPLLPAEEQLRESLDSLVHKTHGARTNIADWGQVISLHAGYKEYAILFEIMSCY